ncbi:hypothetical protein HZI73_05320 [Vallitalea pronyensis]|uniref:Uncharacterized protein n=1 Tax=Vallitalea pronyensis TaxID=1348613 RepID=A0A8J8SFM1_9FIRM|nr:hypothetical protein [Vallitalea pronyensis]QUI21746.1 hypothetical protein HZI73_05320 [Vallitalea pronyensis]
MNDIISQIWEEELLESNEQDTIISPHYEAGPPSGGVGGGGTPSVSITC